MPNDAIQGAPVSAGGKMPLDSEDYPAAPWVADEYRAMVCRVCKVPRVFRRKRIRHPFHFAMALGTLGCWLPVWAVIILLHLLKPWNCTVCRSTQHHG